MLGKRRGNDIAGNGTLAAQKIVNIVRVFVGRMEIITPSIEEDVQQAIATNDRRTLEKYGRFLETIAKRIGARSTLLDNIYSAYLSRGSGCN